MVSAEVLGRRLEVTALQLLLVGIGDGVDDEVEPSPSLLQRLEHGIEAGLVGDVARQDGVQPICCGERCHPLLQRLALIGERDLAAVGVHRPGDRPGDRAVVGDAHDQALLSGHQRCALVH